MKAAPSAAGRPARSRTVAVSASSKPIHKAAGAAALSAAILLGQGSINVPSSTAAPMEHAIFMGGLRSAVNNIKNVGKQGIPEPSPVGVPNSDTPAQTKKAIPIPTVPDLLNATADPNTAPGEGPLRTAAKEESASEGNLNAPPNEAGDAGSTDPAFRNQTRNKLFSSAETLKDVIKAEGDVTSKIAGPGMVGAKGLELGQGFPDAAADIKQNAVSTGGDNSATTDIANVFANSASSIAEGVNKAAAKAGNIASDTVNTGKLQNAADNLDLKGRANAVSQPLGRAVESVKNDVQGAISSSAQSSAQSNNGLTGRASEVVNRAGQGARDVVQGTPTDAKNNTQTAIGNAKRGILGGSASLPSGLERNANKAADSVKDAARQVNAKTSNAGDSVSGSLKDATRSAKSAADDAAGSLKSGARQTNVKGSSVGDSASSAVSDAKNRVGDAAADAKSGVKGAIRDIKNALPGNN